MTRARHCTPPPRRTSAETQTVHPPAQSALPRELRDTVTPPGSGTRRRVSPSQRPTLRVPANLSPTVPAPEEAEEFVPPVRYAINPPPERATIPATPAALSAGRYSYYGPSLAELVKAVES